MSGLLHLRGALLASVGSAQIQQSTLVPTLAGSRPCFHCATVTTGENLYVVFLSPSLPLFAACFAPLRETLSLHISKQFGKRNLTGSFIVKLKINNKGEMPAKIHNLLNNIII
ncbi:elongator complex protein 6 [Platysternon megacephalum]|uniref:Elongator complex protein 6 n=1 Tax=Platysternon megacephalum TaxID=55544 RepID=A0A4D9E812_9SAUR|nr:elongator complex protein 6 [Platysternon megacephalum]